MSWVFALRDGAKKETLELDVLDIIGRGFFFDGVSAQKVVQALKASSATEIRLRVSSIGGDYDEATAIKAALRERAAKGAKITCVVLGLAASAATIITDAADEVEIARGARVMIHAAGTGTGGRGTVEDHQKAIQRLEAANASMLASYVEASKRRGKDKSESEFREKMAKEYYFAAAEAVEWGLADRVTEDVRIAACADVSLLADPPSELVEAYAAIKASLEQPQPTLPTPVPENTPHGGKATMKLSAAVMALLGLPENAEQAAIEQAITTKCAAPVTASAEVMRNLGARNESEGLTISAELVKVGATLLGLTKARTYTDALSEVTSLQANAEVLARTRADNIRLQEEARASGLEAMIEKYSRDEVVNGVVVRAAKLPPSAAPWARSNFKDAAALEQWALSMPLEFARSTGPREGATEDNVTLTQLDRDAAKAVGITEEQMLEQKKLEAKQARASAGGN